MVLMAPAAHFEIGFKRPDPPEVRRGIRGVHPRGEPASVGTVLPGGASRRRAPRDCGLVADALHVNKNQLKLKHPDLRQVVPDFPMPILLIAGERDRATTVEDARWIEQNARDAELFVVEGAAHFMHNERLDLVAPRILEFIAG